jgi:ABC-type nitrate/sulfonate/bicarbonate transport system permease component
MATAKLNGVLFLGALLILWELISQAGWISPLIVPPLSRILQLFYDLVCSGQIPMQILASLKRAAAGYLLAAAVFIPLGIAMGLWRRVYDCCEVIVEMLRPIPPPVVMRVL